MVPVGSLAEHQGLVVDESLSHLGDAEHRAVLVCHPGIHRGVDVKPFLQLLRPHGVNHMALIVERIGWHAGHIASRNAHRQVHLAERYGQLAAVHPLASSLVIVVKVDGIQLCKRLVTSVVADVVVGKVQQIDNLREFVALPDYGVKLEIVANHA